MIDQRMLRQRTTPPVPPRRSRPGQPESGDAQEVKTHSEEFQAQPAEATTEPTTEVASGNIGGTAPPQAAPTGFHPKPPEDFKGLGIPDTLIEALIFKHLLAIGNNTCRGMAKELCVPPKPLLDMVTALKSRQFIAYKGAAAMGDFEYTLTEAGRERAKGYLDNSSYQGAAPVSFKDYVASVKAQTIVNEHPAAEDLKKAFSDLLIPPHLMNRLGPAINSGRGLFLYGYPGNGKTSIAERITLCFGSAIWIPKTIFVEGDIITLFDPQSHEPVDTGVQQTGSATPLKDQTFDPRWIRIQRPTIVVGGELTLDRLELCYNSNTKVTEPSIQLKSNCGTLVIDDFGRQKMNPDALLNRWIIPLEKRFDYLTLSNGKKIQVPFDQLIIFSTNLEPKQLVDDAFLRRIPYKINVDNPSEADFRSLLKIMAKKFEMAYDEAAVDSLLQDEYKAKDRPLRCCHPRDLLLQIVNAARYRGQKPVMTRETFSAACENYFAIM